MSEILRIASAWARANDQGQQGALATVIRTHGSTFRRPGARMLILGDGTTAGSVSGGCLESSIIDAAGEVIRSGESRMLRYDGARDDVVLGEGAMCDGEVAICVERIDEDLSRNLLRLGRSGAPEDVFITIVEEEGRGARSIIGSPPAEDDRPVLFHERVQSPLEVILCGAGALADAVAGMASALGWEPLVVDHRPHFLASMNARTRELKNASDLADLLDRPARTAVVVMTHHFERDCSLVAQALASQSIYVGLLGSRGRSARVLEEVSRAVPGVDPERLRAPVGLDIGSETIEEIALSIVAEIQAVRRGAVGGALREGQSPVHGRRSARLAAIVLAAGGSRRMGSSKLTMPGPEGRPIVDEIVSRVRELELSDLVVVAGADEDIPDIAAKLGARVVVNDDWQEGMGSSIREGVRSLGEDIDAALILLGDQPNVTRLDLERLRDRWRAGSEDVVATRYEEGGGVPAIFHRALFAELRNIEGDRGARDLIRSLESVGTIEMSDTRDVDDRAAWEQVVGASREKRS